MKPKLAQQLSDLEASLPKRPKGKVRESQPTRPLNYHIKRLGIPVIETPEIDYCPRGPLHVVLRDAGIEERFSCLYGIQTASVHGPYAHDVEAVLVCLFDGRKTGSQLIFD